MSAEPVTAAIGNDLIEIKQVVSETKSELRLTSTTAYDTEIENFVNEGAGKLDTESTSIQKCVLLDICDGNKVNLPRGCTEWIAVRLIPEDVGDFEVPVNWSSLTTLVSIIPGDLLYINKPYLSACGLSGVNDPRLPMGDTFQQTQNQLILTFPIPNGANRVLLGYVGRNVDCNGMMYLHAKMEPCMRAYAAWRMMLRYPELWPNSHFQFYRSTLLQHKEDWIQGAKAIRADDAVKNFLRNRYEIKRIFGALLWSQYK